MQALSPGSVHCNTGTKSHHITQLFSVLSQLYSVLSLSLHIRISKLLLCSREREPGLEVTTADTMRVYSPNSHDEMPYWLAKGYVSAKIATVTVFSIIIYCSPSPFTVVDYWLIKITNPSMYS